MPKTELRVIEYVSAMRKESPNLGKEIIAKELLRLHGITVSSSTVGRVISRHGLFFGTSPLHKAKRKQALEKLTHQHTDVHQSEFELASDKESAALFPLPNFS